MKLFRHFITIVCIVASFRATAGEQLTTEATCPDNPPTNPELKLLQGKWEGFLVGDQEQQKITVTISGNSLHFHRDPNFWFDTTIILSASKDPKQLHATIKACPPAQGDSIGKVVRAFFKIEQARLILATIGDDSEETPKGFEASQTRYELRKIQPPENNPELSKTN